MLTVEAGGLGRPFNPLSSATAAAFAAAFARRFCFLRFTVSRGASFVTEAGTAEPVGTPPLDDVVVVGEGWAGGVEAEDLGMVMLLVPSLFVYLAVGGFDTGDAGICATCWLLLAGIATDGLETDGPSRRQSEL